MSELADRVQAAADRLQHAAAAATPGTWRAVPITYRTGTPVFWEISAQQGQNLAENVVTHQTHEGGGIDIGANAAYVVLAQPAVGALLATLLHGIAARIRQLDAADLADPNLIALVDTIKNLEISTNGTP